MYCKNGETEHGIRADCLGKRLQQRYQVRDHAQVFHFQAIVLRCSKECKEWNGLTTTGMLSKGFSFLAIWYMLTYISPCGAEGPDTPYIRWRSPGIAGAELPFADPSPRDRALEISAREETRSVKTAFTARTRARLHGELNPSSQSSSGTCRTSSRTRSYLFHHRFLFLPRHLERDRQWVLGC